MGYCNRGTIHCKLYNVQCTLYKLHTEAFKGHLPSANLKKEEKHIILPTTVTIAVRRSKLWIYTRQNLSEVF